MSPRKPLFVANWKMNKWLNEIDSFLIPFLEQLSDSPKSLGTDYEVVILPQATHLTLLGMGLSSTDIEWGAQNVGPEIFGAYTGEISAGVIKELGGTWALAGHSERRHVFSEDAQMVLKRSLAALEQDLNLILCVGETLESRKAGNTFSVIEEQLSTFKKNSLPSGIEDRLMIAYEPVWAIGTGETATPEMAQEVHQFIRNWLKTHWSEDKALKTRILYGGSVNPENSERLMNEPDIDGVLVGGASLDATKFANLIQNGLKSGS